MQLHLDIDVFPVQQTNPHEAFLAPGKSFDYVRGEGCIGACVGECRNGRPCPFLGCDLEDDRSEVDPTLQ